MKIEELLIDEIDNRINYTERQILNEEKDLQKTKNRIEGLKGELQAYKNIFEFYKYTIERAKNDRIKNN